MAVGLVEICSSVTSAVLLDIPRGALVGFHVGTYEMLSLAESDKCIRARTVREPHSRYMILGVNRDSVVAAVARMSSAREEPGVRNMECQVGMGVMDEWSDMSIPERSSAACGSSDSSWACDWVEAVPDVLWAYCP